MPTTWYKPAGVPVFPRHDATPGPSVLAEVLDKQPWRQELPWPKGFEGGIAHRLDNGTSGAVLLADSPLELDELRGWFSGKLLTKTYWMIASCDVKWSENRCSRPIAHHARRKTRMVVQRGPDTPHRGQWYDADSRFRWLKGRCFEVTITTGVTHQIRVHAAFLGIPLAGDHRYGGGELPDNVPQDWEFCLHHVGMTGPNGFATQPVLQPSWAK